MGATYHIIPACGLWYSSHSDHASIACVTYMLCETRCAAQVAHSNRKDWSKAEKPSKNSAKKSIIVCTSWLPACSRIECIESIAQPTSTVRIPSVDSIAS